MGKRPHSGGRWLWQDDVTLIQHLRSPSLPGQERTGQRGRGPAEVLFWTGTSPPCSSSLLPPTCVLWSFPNLFGESVGTSEALIECLERETEYRHILVILLEYNNDIPLKSTTGSAGVRAFLMHSAMRWKHHSKVEVLFERLISSVCMFKFKYLC